VESQLGSFQVALALDEEGWLGAVLLSGEFLAGEPTVRSLEESLVGCEPRAEAVGRKVEEVLARPGRFVLGLGPEAALTEAVLEAARRPAGLHR
jgi:hypothetical protein